MSEDNRHPENEEKRQYDAEEAIKAWQDKVNVAAQQTHIGREETSWAQVRELKIGRANYPKKRTNWQPKEQCERCWDTCRLVGYRELEMAYGKMKKLVKEAIANAEAWRIAEERLASIGQRNERKWKPKADLMDILGREQVGLRKSQKKLESEDKKRMKLSGQGTGYEAFKRSQYDGKGSIRAWTITPNKIYGKNGMVRVTRSRTAEDQCGNPWKQRRKRETFDSHKPYTKGRQEQKWTTQYDQMYREGINLQRWVNIMSHEEEIAKEDCVGRLFDEMENIKIMQEELEVEKAKARGLVVALKKMSDRYDQCYQASCERHNTMCDGCGTGTEVGQNLNA